MTTRTQQKQKTAHAVLTAARQEFEEKGFNDASIRGIATTAGVSAGTVIHHFGSKRELLYAALFDDLEATLEDALANPGDGPLPAQLSRLTKAIFAYYRARPRLSRTLLKESLFADPPWAEKFQNQVTSVHQEIATWATRAKEANELPEDIDIPLLGVAYFSFFYFGLIAWAQGAHPTPELMIDRLINQHLQILTHTTTSQREHTK